LRVMVAVRVRAIAGVRFDAARDHVDGAEAGLDAVGHCDDGGFRRWERYPARICAAPQHVGLAGVCRAIAPLPACRDGRRTASQAAVARPALFRAVRVRGGATVALVLRLPTAEGTPGKLIWTIMGTDTATNLQALTYSSSALMVLLAEGVLNGWVFPNRPRELGTSRNVSTSLPRHKDPTRRVQRVPALRRTRSAQARSGEALAMTPLQHAARRCNTRAAPSLPRCVRRDHDCRWVGRSERCSRRSSVPPARPSCRAGTWGSAT
jgi:hypothetical protein